MAKLRALHVKDERYIVPLKEIQRDFLIVIESAVIVIELHCFDLARKAVSPLIKNGVTQFPQLLACHVVQQRFGKHITVAVFQLLEHSLINHG